MGDKCPVRVWGFKSIKAGDGVKQRKTAYKEEWKGMRLPVVESNGRKGWCYILSCF